MRRVQREFRGEVELIGLLTHGLQTELRLNGLAYHKEQQKRQQVELAATPDVEEAEEDPLRAWAAQVAARRAVEQGDGKLRPGE